ncbi:amidohydrolase family protein [Roseateles sp.]|uniref:amidohydrolase family protein n=1 Tax=Roseateles sp. TaxID=1971397 RepID=UPI00286B1C02|nr:amidohydrolase family protein [Roseateles sp.]
MRLKSSIFCLLASFALTALAEPAEPNPPAFKAGPPQSMELKNAQWFDGKGFVKRGTLYVKDGKFSAQKIKKPQRSLDLMGQFLIPPLAEAHNHNLQNAWGYGRFTNNYLRDGVFYAAMHCGEPKGAAAVRGLANQPAAPDVLFVTACITSSDGQPLAQLLGDEAGAPKLKLDDVVDKLVLIMDSPEQVAQKWPLVAPRKTDLVKLMLSRSDSPELRADPKQQGRLGLKPDVPTAIVKRAHQDGLRVIAHVDTAADFALALQSGVDWIDHLPGYFFHEGLGVEAYRISPEMAAEAAKQRVAVTTGTAAATLFRAPPETLAALRRLQIENLHTLKAAGVKLLLGSDVFNGNALTELRHLDSLGVLDRAALLRLATISTPQALFPKRRLGCFEPGCEASFLLLTSNPLNDLDALSRIQLRVKQGRVLNLQSP